jgi:hypothetical protein
VPTARSTAAGRLVHGFKSAEVCVKQMRMNMRKEAARLQDLVTLDVLQKGVIALLHTLCPQRSSGQQVATSAQGQPHQSAGAG